MKNIYYSNTSYIKAKTSAIRNERLDFMEGKKLGDLSIRIEDNATVRNRVAYLEIVKKNES